MGSAAPDGGYGWVVVIFAFLSQALSVGITWSSGVFYVLFMHKFDSHQTPLALITAINNSIFYLTGPVAAYFTNLYGCRLVHMVGGVIACVGLVLSGLASNIYLLAVSYGFITGLGFGLCFIPSYNIVSVYFEKRRTLAMGLTSTGAGMGTLVIPPILRMLFSTYGYLGCFILTGGISLNLVVSGAIFKPMKQTKITDKTEKPKEVKAQSKWMRGLNCHLFNDSRFILLCLNNLCITFVLSVVFVHFAAYASTFGHSETSCAMLYCGMGISSTICRFLYSFVGMSPRIKPVHFYTGVDFFAGVITLLVPLVKAYYMLMMYCVCFGVFIAIYSITLPLYIVELLSVDMLPSGYGYALIFEAVGQAIGGPVAGLLYQSTGYYGSSLYLAGGMMLLAGAIMLPTCIKRKRSSDLEDQ